MTFGEGMLIAQMRREIIKAGVSYQLGRLQRLIESMPEKIKGRYLDVMFVHEFRLRQFPESDRELVAEFMNYLTELARNAHPSLDTTQQSGGTK